MSAPAMTASAETPHILVVDDDERLRALLQRYLSTNDFRVSAASNAAEARALMKSIAFDLLIVDVMMPGETGLELTKSVRAQSQVPILILTARGEPEDRIAGLEYGADDYLPKPFEPEELLLRIGAVLRRGRGQQAPRQRLSLGRCVFDLERGELYRDDSPVRLTEAEAQLLRRLGRDAYVPIERHLLTDGDGGRAVDIQVTRLRRKIEVDPKNPRYLQTVRGVGYMLSPD